MPNAEKVEVVMSHPAYGHDTGERVSINADDARRLVNAGYAKYATKRDASRAGGEPEQSATAHPS